MGRNAVKKKIWVIWLSACFLGMGCGDGSSDADDEKNEENVQPDNGSHSGDVNTDEGTQSGNNQGDGSDNPGGNNPGGSSDNPGGNNPGGSSDNPGGQTTAVQGMKCGDGECDPSMVCIKGVCVARNNTVASKGTPCKESTFVESCDGNAVVYCGQTVDEAGETVWQVEVTECGDAKCALKARANFGFCVIDEPRCTKETAGQMTYCSIIKDMEGNPVVGGTSYVYYYDCDQATDGNYYAFRDVNNRSEECLAGCLENACSSTDEKCTLGSYDDHCEGRVHYYCSSEGTVERMNCDDYGVDCITGEEMCAW